MFCFIVRHYFFYDYFVTIVRSHASTSTVIICFIPFLTLMLTAMSAAKRSKSDAKQFHESWTSDFGFAYRTGKAVLHTLLEKCRLPYLKYQTSF